MPLRGGWGRHGCWDVYSGFNASTCFISFAEKKRMGEELDRHRHHLEELVELEMPDSEELVLLEMVCLVEQVRNGILLMGLVEVDEHDLHVQELPDDFMDEEEEQIVRQGQEHKVSSSSPILPYHLLLL